MSPCSSWEDRLVEVALGAAPESTLGSHVATCLSCREALVELRKARARLDVALEESTRTEPSPGFRARVMAGLPRVDEAGSRWRWVRVAAAVAVALAAVLLSSRRGTAPTPADARDLLAWRSPTESLLRSHTNELFEAPPLGAFYFEFPNSRTEDDHVKNEK